MKIIGLTGAAGSGKDTACGFALEWCREKGIRAERFAFADALKVSAARALGFDGDREECVNLCNELKQPHVELHVVDRAAGEREDELLCEGKITGREFLQFYGTEAHRDVFGTEFWVETLEGYLAEAAGAVQVAFITDARFPNEAQMVHKHDGEVWEVVRPGQETVEAHASEAGLPDGAIEFQIRNDGSLEDLRTLIHSVCESNLEGVA